MDGSRTCLVTAVNAPTSVCMATKRSLFIGKRTKNKALTRNEALGKKKLNWLHTAEEPLRGRKSTFYLVPEMVKVELKCHPVVVQDLNLIHCRN